MPLGVFWALLAACCRSWRKTVTKGITETVPKSLCIVYVHIHTCLERDIDWVSSSNLIPEQFNSTSSKIKTALLKVRMILAFQEACRGRSSEMCPITEPLCAGESRLTSINLVPLTCTFLSMLRRSSFPCFASKPTHSGDSTFTCYLTKHSQTPGSLFLASTTNLLVFVSALSEFSPSVMPFKYLLFAQCYIFIERGSTWYIVHEVCVCVRERKTEVMSQLSRWNQLWVHTFPCPKFALFVLQRSHGHHHCGPEIGDELTLLHFPLPIHLHSSFHLSQMARQMIEEPKSDDRIYMTDKWSKNQNQMSEYMTLPSSAHQKKESN